MPLGKGAEGVAARRRSKAQGQELGEAAPRRGALILLDLEEPNPGVIFQITGSHPYLFFLHDAFPVEVGLALVDEGQRIRFPIKFRKIH